MSHGNFHAPDFDFDLFRTSTETLSAAGFKVLIMEWQTGPGAIVTWYPAGERQSGESWRCDPGPSHNNEQNADYLEHDLLPRLEEVARGKGFQVRTRCVDQQPVQVMRMRRRELERAQQSSGLAPSAH